MPRKSRRQWPDDETCIEPACLNKRYAGRLRCQKHHLLQKEGPRCAVNECDRAAFARGWCQAHYYRWKRTGDVREVEALRDHSNYGTGRAARRRDGYVLLYHPDHPDANSKGYIAEHRLVMESMIGRRLLPSENVHHRNGVRDDNRVENLELWVVPQPQGQRAADLLEWAEEVVARYHGLRANPALTGYPRDEKGSPLNPSGPRQHTKE